jgi:hypothetical protein
VSPRFMLRFSCLVVLLFIPALSLAQSCAEKGVGHRLINCGGQLTAWPTCYSGPSGCDGCFYPYCRHVHRSNALPWPNSVRVAAARAKQGREALCQLLALPNLRSPGQSVRVF